MASFEERVRAAWEAWGQSIGYSKGGVATALRAADATEPEIGAVRRWLAGEEVDAAMLPERLAKLIASRESLAGALECAARLTDERDALAATAREQAAALAVWESDTGAADWPDSVPNGGDIAPWNTVVLPFMAKRRRRADAAAKAAREAGDAAESAPAHEAVALYVHEHKCDGKRGENECMKCGEEDCPGSEPLHYDDDGCPHCESVQALADAAAKGEPPERVPTPDEAEVQTAFDVVGADLADRERARLAGERVYVDVPRRYGKAELQRKLIERRAATPNFLFPPDELPPTPGDIIDWKARALAAEAEAKRIDAENGALRAKLTNARAEATRLRAALERATREVEMGEWDVAALLATVEALRAELAEAVRVLSEVEWVRHDWGGSSGFECPCCGAHDYLDEEEHEDGCDLAVFLARHKEVRP